MNNDDYFKKLNQKAKEEPVAVNTSTPRPKTPRLFQPYGFATYTGMTPKVGWGIFIYFMAWFFFALVFTTSDIKVNVPLWLKLGGALGVILFLSILAGYFRFKGWVERLPFPLIGWTELIHAHKMNKQRYYRLVTIEVVMEPGSSNEELTHVNNALKIHNNAQNRWIKKERFGDGRQQWKILTPVSSTGTLNNVGMGRLKKRLETEFSEIQKRTGHIEKILIHYDKKEITWEPPADVT